MTLHLEIYTLLRSNLPVHMNDAKVDNITTDIMAIIENSSVTLSEDQYKNVLTADYQAEWLENDRVWKIYHLQKF